MNQEQISQGITSALDEPLIVNVKANSRTVGDSLEVTVYGVFFANVTGDFYSTAYLLENNVSQPQAGISDPGFKHNHVLRAAGKDGLGYLVATGNIRGNDSFKKTFRIYLDPSWNSSNLELVSVVWKDEGNAFRLMNVTKE